MSSLWAGPPAPPPRPRRLALPHLRAWDIVAGSVVAVFGLLEVGSYWLPIADASVDRAIQWLAIVAGMAAATLWARTRPGLALTLVWVACGVQVLSWSQVFLVQFAAIYVAYAIPRYGSTLMVWLSGLSVPVGTFIAIQFVGYYQGALVWLIDLLRPVLTNAPIPGYAGALALLFLPLGFPWSLGLYRRVRSQMRATEAERQAALARQEAAEEDSARATEIAALQASHAQLARDVHDVVGHSLAVILAQAESAQYLPDDDPAALQATMDNIAGAARRSLQEVRQVLSSTKDATAAVAPDGGLDALVEGLRTAGHDVSTTTFGTPQPLPPELELVAYRVLQEMLTNAIKHGRRDRPVVVERRWVGQLQIEVRNTIDESVSGTDPVTGQGVPGMRRRLESVGGRFFLHRETSPDGEPIAVATAWVPLRPVNVGYERHQ